MDYTLLIYLASVTGNLSVLFGVVGGIGMFGAIVATIVIVCENMSANDAWKYSYYRQKDGVPEPEKVNAFKVTGGYIITAFCLLFLSALLPSERTVYTMVAAGVVQDVAENPRVQHIGDQVLELISDKLDDYIGDDSDTNNNEDSGDE